MRVINRDNAQLTRSGCVDVTRWEQFGLDSELPFKAMWYSVPPNSSSPPDQHPEVELSLVITGMVKYTEIDSSAALANAFVTLGQPGFATLIAAGAVAGLTTVVLTLLIGASRVVFAMSRDHLLPAPLSKVHPRFQTPWVITISIGVIVMLVAGLTPIGKRCAAGTREAG